MELIARRGGHAVPGDFARMGGPAPVRYDEGDPTKSEGVDCTDLAVAGEPVVVSWAAGGFDICATGDGRTARQYQAGVGHCGITHADCRSGHCAEPASAADDWHCSGDSHIDISLHRVGVPGRFSLAWNDGWTIAAILVIGYILLVQVFRAGPVNAVRIQGAVAAYLLLGLPMHTVIKSRNTLMPPQSPAPKAQ